MINDFVQLLGEKNFEKFQKALMEMLIEAFERDLNEYLQSNYVFDFEAMLEEIEEAAREELKQKAAELVREKQEEILNSFLKSF